MNGSWRHQPIRTVRYKVRAITDKFYLNGHVAEAGEEGVLDSADAETARAAGRVEIIGPAPDLIIPAKDVQDHRPPASVFDGKRW